MERAATLDVKVLLGPLVPAHEAKTAAIGLLPYAGQRRPTRFCPAGWLKIGLLSLGLLFAEASKIAAPPMRAYRSPFSAGFGWLGWVAPLEKLCFPQVFTSRRLRSLPLARFTADADAGAGADAEGLQSDTQRPGRDMLQNSLRRLFRRASRLPCGGSTILGRRCPIPSENPLVNFAAGSEVALLASFCTNRRRNETTPARLHFTPNVLFSDDATLQASATD